MTVLQDQQQVKFETTTDGSDETDLAMLSADYIIRLGNNFGTIRYFDQQDKHLDYRVSLKAIQSLVLVVKGDQCGFFRKWSDRQSGNDDFCQFERDSSADSF